jgi:hypothetical protein
MKSAVVMAAFSLSLALGSIDSAPLTDRELLDTVQRSAFDFFWEFSSPVSDIARSSVKLARRRWRDG